MDIKKRARHQPLYGQFQSVGNRAPSGLWLTEWKYGWGQGVRGVDVKKKAGNRPLYGQPQALGAERHLVSGGQTGGGVCVCVCGRVGGGEGVWTWIPRKRQN